MPKKEDESYIDYRKRVLDPVSPSFCAAKWFNATIWLGSGNTASCHHPPAHRIPLSEVRRNHKAIHNTTHKKLMRAQMLRGERPSECDYCWKIEDIKRDNASDRIFKSIIYKDADIETLKNHPADADVGLKTLEIAFDRTCNFACSYCNASFSTTWAKDIRKNGGYQNLVSDGAKAFQQNGDWAEPFSRDETNPYIEAFWKWWPELSESLTELRVTGGEPLLSPQLWKLLDEVRASKPKQLRLAINSNLGAADKYIDRLIEASHEFQNIDLYTSCEAFGAQAEYIRDGLEFELFCKNVEKVLEKGAFRELHIMMTINSLCLFSLPRFLDLVFEWKGRFGSHAPTISVNLLRFPSFMSPLTLPEELRSYTREHLLTWLDSRSSDPNFLEFERAGLQRLVDYLDVVKTPHRRTSSLKSQWRDFKSFYQQYDQRRGKNFAETFPSVLVDWYDSLPDTNLDPQPLVDGDATNFWKDSRELKKLAKREGWVLDPEDENPR